MSLENQPQPQEPPQQPPPPPRAAGGALDEPLARPPTATVDSSLTVSSWPCGQAAGAPDSLIGRVTRKVSPQARQRNSYLGTRLSLPRPPLGGPRGKLALGSSGKIRAIPNGRGVTLGLRP